MISVYINSSTWLHRISASVKLGCLAVISFVLIKVDNIFGMGSFFLCIIFIYASAGTNVLRRIALVRPLLPLLIVIILIHVWVGSVHDGLLATIRLLGMVLLANLITMTTKVTDMMDAIMPLFKPLDRWGNFSKKLSLSVALCFRYVTVLFDLWKHMDESFRARSGKHGGVRLLPSFLIQVLILTKTTGDALFARGGASGYNITERSMFKNE